MYVHVRVRLTGGRAVDHYGGILTRVRAPFLGELSITDGARQLGSYAYTEWTEYQVRKTEDIPTRVEVDDDVDAL